MLHLNKLKLLLWNYILEQELMEKYIYYFVQK
jgi:hypothetical protein